MAIQFANMSEDLRAFIATYPANYCLYVEGWNFPPMRA
jgi:hypothetical protein